MIDPVLWIAAALAAVLADRYFLGGRLGDPSGSPVSTRLGRVAAGLATVPIVLTIGAAVAGLLSVYVFEPLRAGYLTQPAFAATVLACAVTGESLCSGERATHRNRAFARAGILALLLGFPVLPFYREGTAAGCAVLALSGAGIGVTYAVMVLLYNGIGEKISADHGREARMSPARDLGIAGLLALVCIGILKTFH